jgi:hypothetical protein
VGKSNQNKATPTMLATMMVEMTILPVFENSLEWLIET